MVSENGGVDVVRLRELLALYENGAAYTEDGDTFAPACADALPELLRVYEAWQCRESHSYTDEGRRVVRHGWFIPKVIRLAE